MKSFWSSPHQRSISQISETTRPTIGTEPVQGSQRPDIWRDPVWQALGVIVGAVLALAAILISLRQWQRKLISYEVISKENIVRISDNSVESELQILYQGKPVKDLYLISVKFINSGNTEIRPQDYVRKMSLSFGGQSEILGNKVLEQEPQNLGIKIDPDKDKKALLIEPVLLNKKDNFTIQVLVTGFQDVIPNGRIAGVSKIQEVSPLKLDTKTLAAFVSLSTATATLVSGFLSIQAEIVGISDDLTTVSLVLLASLMATVTAYIANQIQPYKRKKK